MIETREILEHQLQEYQIDKENHEKALEETRSLLERADLKRKSEPNDKKKWDEALSNLETSLDKIKHKLNLSENNIVSIHRKLENWNGEENISNHSIESSYSTPDDLPTSTPVKPELQSMVHNKQLFEAALERILNSPAFLINKLSEDDINIARVYIQSDVIKSMPFEQVEEIKKRIIIYDRRKEKGKRTKPAKDEMESLTGIRVAFDKCIKMNYSQITLEELEAIRKYYEMVTTNEEASAEDQKRIQILKKSIKNINEILHKFPDI